MLFDTHAHYDDERFDEDRETLLRAMPEKGVGLIVNPGCDLPSSRMAVDMAQKYDFLYAAVGIHPENCGDFAPAMTDGLRALIKAPKVVAIGEIGLDYYWAENPPKELQQEVLRRQLALAQELHLPVIIHDRDAHADTLSIVREFPQVTGVFHCFAGSVEMAQALIKMGWMLSFNGAATFKNAKKAPEVIAAVPLEKLMIETDAPYLTPVPHRGERNDSSYVRFVAEKIAEIKGISAEEVEKATWENGKAFFGIRKLRIKNCLIGGCGCRRGDFFMMRKWAEVGGTVRGVRIATSLRSSQ